METYSYSKTSITDQSHPISPLSSMRHSINPFVAHDSIVREIWGSADVILFIFAGAAAEFSVNKAVDWLYFTGKLPKDPLGRLFSTVAYARKIVFANVEGAHAAIDHMTGIHRHVETARGAQIPDWAYRDVLFMLINYSVRAFEILERKLTTREKQDVFKTFYQVGMRMKINGLPTTFPQWELMHQTQLKEDLAYSRFSEHLFQQYRKHLGWFRYLLVLKIQALLAPNQVKKLLGLKGGFTIKAILAVYKKSKVLGLQKILRNLLLPPKYKAQVIDLDRPAV